MPRRRIERKWFDELKGKLIKKIPAFSQKVAPIYKLLDWVWQDKAVPNADWIAQELRMLIDGMKDEGETRTGGLKVWIYKDGESG